MAVELQEMWHVGLGVAQCVCIALLPTSIGMYAFLGTRSTRYYQGLERVFRWFLPNWICPLVYTAWMATMGFVFWLTAFAVDCNNLKYGFDLNPWTNFFFILWTVPMGLRLFFFSGSQWRGLLLTTDLVALAFAIAHFVMAAINKADQPEAVCAALSPVIVPLGKFANVFFYASWGSTIAMLFVVTLRDLVILLKPLQSFVPVDSWMQLWYEAEAGCQSLCPELTDGHVLEMEAKHPGYAEAVKLIREADHDERIAVVKARMTKAKQSGAYSSTGGPNEEAALASVTDDNVDPLDMDERPAERNMNANDWLNRAVLNQRKGQKF